MLRLRQARYEIMIYDRFRDFDVVSRHGRDIDIAREIGKLLAKHPIALLI